MVFSTSLGQEDQVLTHHIGINKFPITVFTLDTASSRDKELEKHSGTKIELAQEVGKLVHPFTKSFSQLSAEMAIREIQLYNL